VLLEEIRNIDSSKGALRRFGFTIGVALAILGGIVIWRGGHSYPYIFGLSAVFVLAGSLLPILLWPVHRVWMIAAIALGWFVSRLILCILFYVAVTPIGLVGRLLGKRFLSLELDENSDSYWLKRDSSEKERKSYENQF
jgi:hypothetical protein